jgi:hypothetical protein
MTGRRRGQAFVLRAALVAAIVAVLVAIVAPLLVDRDALVHRIEAEMSAAIGLPVQVDAVTRLALLPAPHAVLGPVRVLAPAGADDSVEASPLAEAQRLQLELAWPALLLGHIEPARLRAEGLDLHWHPSSVLPPPRWLAALTVLAPRVHDATLTLDYPSGSRRLRWPLSTPSSDGTPAASPLGTSTMQRPGPLRIAATLPLAQTKPGRTGHLRLDAEADLMALPALTIAPLQLAGNELDLGALDDLSIGLSAERIHRSADGRWRLQGLALTSGALRIDGSLDLYRGGDGRLAGEGRLSLAPLDLRAWLAGHHAKPLPGAPQTLSCVAGDGLFRLAEGLLVVAPAALRVDTTRAGGAATITLGPVPRAGVAARLDQLDLDSYLAPAGLVTAGPAAASKPCTELPSTAPAAPAPPAPAGDNTELRLDLAIDSLQADGLTYGNIRVLAAQQGPKTTADIDAAAFYGGTLSAQVAQTSQSGAAPRQTLRTDVRGADLGTLLTDLQGTAQASGRADLMADLAATGWDPAAIRRDLSGTLHVDLSDGRLAALDQAAASFAPLLSAIGLPVTPDTFAFSRLQARAEGDDGVFNIADLDGRARLFRLRGGGRVDAGAETLELALSATLLQPVDGPDLKDLAGIEVPIRVTGSISAPAVKADLAPAVAEAARRTARRHLEKDGNPLQKLEEATGVQGLEQGLRNLFGL